MIQRVFRARFGAVRRYSIPNNSYKESFERAREPYRVRNAVTFVALSSLAISIYFYSINAVKQEDFSSVPMPEKVSKDESQK
ncbi:hypothetical protein BB560_000786 [Smittium megazygosporum]|uniref:Cytochrome c oxidase assembly factor 3 n=1 Tax=Smittium megazygosporum TaxID=133381 RepID=A0A2T9ZJB5_9FUNG|nr:hypothetical protein BB560_000786 [Smittium megazygosporum]